MTLNKLPSMLPFKTTSMPLANELTELTFSSGETPSSKLTLNISAFNGNKTNFGGNRNGNK